MVRSKGLIHKQRVYGIYIPSETKASYFLSATNFGIDLRWKRK